MKGNMIKFIKFPEVKERKAAKGSIHINQIVEAQNCRCTIRILFIHKWFKSSMSKNFYACKSPLRSNLIVFQMCHLSRKKRKEKKRKSLSNQSLSVIMALMTLSNVIKQKVRKNKKGQIHDLLQVLKGHILQERWMSQNKASPLFLVNLPIMFCISFLKGLEKQGKKRSSISS